jgi:hypothetical protein
MKTLLSSIIAILVLAVFSVGEINAQENQNTKQKELLKKKQLSEQKKQEMELDSISKKTQATSEGELKILIEAQKQAQSESNELFDQDLRHRSRDIERSYRVPEVYNKMYFNKGIPFFAGSGDNTTFSISKKIKDITTFSSDFEYEVPENVTSLYFTFGSELESGTLKLSITKPNGKTYQAFSVAPVANVDWNKQIKIKEGEAKDYSGTWKITISTKEAKGYYELKVVSF